MDDLQQLGGNIDLVGFRQVDGGSMIVVKKLVGNYARKFSDRLAAFERLTLTVKPVHHTEGGSSMYELHAKVCFDGKSSNADTTDHNLFFAVDKVLKGVEKQTLQ